MFKHRHFKCEWYVDEKTLLRKEKHKRVSKEWLNYIVWLKVYHMNIFARHDQSAWEKSLQITWNRWVAHLTSKVSVCKAWYTMMMTIDLKNLISLLSFDSQMS